MDLVEQEVIVKMTGVKQPAAQFRRLLKLGFKCWRNALGEVILLSSELNKQAVETTQRPLRKSQK